MQKTLLGVFDILKTKGGGKILVSLLALTALLFAISSAGLETSFTLFNLKRFIQIMIVLTLIQIGGVWLKIILGHRLGLFVAAVLSGLVSSTSATLSAAQAAAKATENGGSAAESRVLILVSTSSSLLLLLVIVYFFAPDFAGLLLRPIFLTAALLLGHSLYIVRFKSHQFLSHTKELPEFEITEVLKSSAFLVLMMFFVSSMEKLLEAEQIILLSFFAGLFELHGLTMATTNLYLEGAISTLDSVRNILVALLASLIAKIAIVLMIQPNRHGLKTSMVFFLASLILLIELKLRM